MLLSSVLHKSIIKNLAKNLGFDFCGIAKAEYLDDDAARLEKWLKNGRHGNMQYMENHFDMRVNPTLLVPGAASVITLLFNYYPSQTQVPEAPKISKYAYGKDYHEVIRAKLHEFLFEIRSQIGEVNGRGFVDSAPVLERAWALRSGLGWIGKNGNVINKQAGSFFFIATLITDLKLEPDDVYAKDYCGSCTRCIDECPTEAILPNKEIDGSKCISYHTIELKSAIIDSNYKDKFDGWMFGCDTCQDVCPWNRFSKPHTHKELEPIAEILNLSKDDWFDLSEDAFKTVFKQSPLKRSKYSGILRNLNFVYGDSSEE